MEEKEFKDFRIWYQQLDDKGNVIGTGVYHKTYATHANASRVAGRLYGNKPNIRYDVAVLDPFIDHYQDATCDICGRVYKVSVDPYHALPVIENHLSILSRHAIPSKKPKRYFSKSIHACDDCILKVKSFVDSIPKVGEQ